jgi:hypothetical protein
LGPNCSQEDRTILAPVITGFSTMADVSALSGAEVAAGGDGGGGALSLVHAASGSKATRSANLRIMSPYISFAAR